MASFFSAPRLLVSTTVGAFALVSAAAVWNRSPDMQFLMLALLAMTALGSFVDARPVASLLTLLATLGLYAGVYFVLGSDGLFTQEGMLGALLLVFTALGGLFLSRRIRDIERRHARQAQLIDDLTIYDQQTGVLRAGHIQQIIDYEVSRARRYDEPLTVATVEIVDGPYGGKPTSRTDLRELQGKLSRLFLEMLRNVDRVGYGSSKEIVLILPSTAQDGAEVVAARLVRQAQEQLGANIVVGVSTFPDEGSDSETLIAEARAALEFGRMNSISVVSKGLLGAA